MGGEEQLMDKQIKQRVHTESNMRFGMEKKPAGKRTRKSKVGQRLGFNTGAQWKDDLWTKFWNEHGSGGTGGQGAPVNTTSARAAPSHSGLHKEQGKVDWPAEWGHTAQTDSRAHASSHLSHSFTYFLPNCSTHEILIVSCLHVGNRAVGRAAGKGKHWDSNSRRAIPPSGRSRGAAKTAYISRYNQLPCVYMFAECFLCARLWAKYFLWDQGSPGLTYITQLKLNPL